MAVKSVVGGTVAWHVENDKSANAVLQHHYPTIPNFGDVTGLDFADVPNVDVLTAGYPCQPFSNAGNRLGENDERHLWPHVVRAVSGLGPRFVVLENVRGHLSMGFATVLSDLASMGFHAEWGIVGASDVGAPHHRKRLFVFAYRNVADPGGKRHGGRQNVGMVGGMGTTPKSGRRETRAARQIVGDRGATNFGKYGPAVERWEKIIKRPAPDPAEKNANGESQLSPRFVEWLMGIPEGWVTDPVIGITRNQQLKMLGNGVVPLSAQLALSIMSKNAETLEGKQ